MRKLTELSRKENAEALLTLKKKGIIFTEPSSESERSTYGEIGRSARRMLVGELFPQDLLDRLESALEEFRRTSAAGPK